jgi:hypothetical protein
MILYHYTSKTAFDQITATGNILPTDPWTTMDKAYGYGWYFTDLEPDKCDAWTVAHCWRTVSEFTKVQCYLKFEIPDGLAKYCREHVYMLSSWDNRIKYLEGKETPKCGKGSCLVCDIMTKVKQFLGMK